MNNAIDLDRFSKSESEIPTTTTNITDQPPILDLGPGLFALSLIVCELDHWFVYVCVCVVNSKLPSRRSFHIFVVCAHSHVRYCIYIKRFFPNIYSRRFLSSRLITVLSSPLKKILYMSYKNSYQILN